MRFPRWVFLFLFAVVAEHAPTGLSNLRTHEAGMYCSRSVATTNFVPVFVKEMENLLELVTEHHYGTYSVNNITYGLAQCHADLSPMGCQLCFAESRTRLPRCLPSVAAHIYLRYDNYSFYGETVDPERDSVNCTVSGGGTPEVPMGFER